VAAKITYLFNQQLRRVIVPKPLSSDVEKLDVLFDNHPAYQPLRETGFTRANLTSIVGSTKKPELFAAVAESLVSHLDLIKSIQKSTSFKVSNIVSILSKSRLGVVMAISALDQNADKVSELTSCGFTASNISCILAGTTKSVGHGLDALIQHKYILLELRQLGFTINNASTMLAASGIFVGHALKALAHHKGTLQELLDHGFSNSQLSSMLVGSKTNMGRTLIGLTEHKDILIELVKKGFPTKYISSSLRGYGPKLGQAITELAENKEYLAGIIRTKPNTYIKKANLTAEDQSTASSTDSHFPSWVMKEDLINGGTVSLQSGEATIWGKMYFDADSDSVSSLETSRKRSAGDAFDY
jgi:hypothetical protein